MAQKWYRKTAVQVAIVTGIFLLASTMVVQFSPKARLEKEVEDLKGEVQRLETQLVPFRTLAIERFGGSPEEALAKLATQVQGLEAQIKRASSTIYRFDVAAVVTLLGDWKSDSPPDFSNLLRRSNRSSDIRVELKISGMDMRWIEFKDSSGPKMNRGKSNSWVLDYTAQAPAGSWILGVSHNDLQKCGAVDMVLYGIDHNVTRDSVITVTDVVLTFHVNGIPAYYCKYQPNLTAKISEELGSPIRVHLNGSVSIQKIP